MPLEARRAGQHVSACTYKRISSGTVFSQLYVRTAEHKARTRTVIQCPRRQTRSQKCTHIQARNGMVAKCSGIGVQRLRCIGGRAAASRRSLLEDEATHYRRSPARTILKVFAADARGQALTSASALAAENTFAPTGTV